MSSSKLINQLSPDEQRREDNMAELRAHFKVIFGHSPVSRNGLKGVMKISKKKIKPAGSTDDTFVRRSERIRQKDKSPSYVEQNIRLDRKTTFKVADLVTVEAIDMNAIKTVNAEASDSGFECEDCGATFSFKNSLQKHKISKHTENSYKCSICGKSFLRFDSVKRHKEKIHSDNPDVQYPCNLCSKTFRYKQNLVKHLKNSHSR
eukprot:GFUD01023490.1.p1 GENE.GFUD01023490.1~~GFUD01023490.1.p1  ORF type:complete len:205 (+),score=26.21 GFUD01023490.1:52-666(+)